MTVFAHAVLGPDGLPLDQIRLTGVSATGHHGVFEHERADGQEFRADVVLHLDTRAAAVGDDLGATVSYTDVAQDVHDVLAGSPADLIETVAERVAAAALARPGVVAVDVRLHKPQAPIPVPFDDVEVAIRRDHVKTPVVKTPVVDPVPAMVEPAAAPGREPVPAPVPVSAPVPVPVPVAGPAETPAAPVPPAPEPYTPDDAFTAHSLDRLEADPPDPVEAVLAIGANLGDPQATLRAAVTDLDRLPGIQVMEVSPLARTTAVGGPGDQPDYLNAVLVIRTTLSARSLLRATQAVENAHGRVREERWGPRTLDVDIIRYGSVVADADDLTVPHPRAHERGFVLVPWAEVQPDAILPGLGGGPVRQLAETAPDRAGIRWLALDWLQEPTETMTGALRVAPASAPVDQVAQPAPVPGQQPAPAPAEQPAPVWAEQPAPGPAQEPAPAPAQRPAPASTEEPEPGRPDQPRAVEPAPESRPFPFPPRPEATQHGSAATSSHLWPAGMTPLHPSGAEAQPAVPAAPPARPVPEVEQTSVDGQRWTPPGTDGGQ